jgi:hypothetical protein
MKKVETTICYLCGEPLCPPINVDHPVMQQLFAPDIRRKHNVSKLITFNTHQACNAAYQSDEDYFVRSLMPFARGSVAGNAIYAKVLNDFRTGKQVPLTRMVLSEFEQNPSGLFLPGRQGREKIRRRTPQASGGKMVRGLHFYHTREVLPEKWSTVGVQIFAGETPPRDDVLLFAKIAQPRGGYPGVIDYKFDKFTESNNLHYWLLLLWDRIIIRVIFHDPACACERCPERHSEKIEDVEVATLSK